MFSTDDNKLKQCLVSPPNSLYRLKVYLKALRSPPMRTLKISFIDCKIAEVIGRIKAKDAGQNSLD